MVEERRNNKCTEMLCFIFALSTYFNEFFYTMWNTYPVRIISMLCSIIYYLGGLILIILSIKPGIKINFRARYTFIIAILFVISANWLGQVYKIGFNAGHFWTAIEIFFLLSLDKEKQNRIFHYLILLFVVFTVPSAIYYFFKMVGVNLPHTILRSDQFSKDHYGAYYEHYFLGLILRQGGVYPRLTGVFDEPGVVGTFCALFLAACYNRNEKKNVAVLMFIVGLISTSKAFYILLIIYIIVYQLIKRSYKSFLIFLGLLVLLVLFFNIEFKSETISSIQNSLRLIIFDFQFQRSRISASFYNVYSKIVHEGGYALWFGNGQGAVIRDGLSGYSYHILIYNYGIIGTGLLFGIYISIIRYMKLNKHIIPFIVVFLLSVYQRPIIYTVQYFALFICAITHINTVNNVIANNNARIRLRGRLKMHV